MSLKSMLAGAAGKALLISFAGAAAMGALPAATAQAATLSELYLTDMVLRNCTMDFNSEDAVHDGEDMTYDEDTDGEIITPSRRRAARVTRAIESTVQFLKPSDEQFEAIFDPINAQISQDIEQFCIDNIPAAQSVMNSL